MGGVDDLQLAYADYVIMFPDLASLGVGAVTWKAEYDRVKALGLSQVTVVQSAMEGGTSVQALRNFSQKILLAALHARRSALDEDYKATINELMPQLGQVNGQVIRLGAC